MIINKVIIKGKYAECILDNGYTFTLLLETYTNNPILVGEEIDIEEIEKLIKENKYSEAKTSLLNKIVKKKLSKNECLKFLLELNLDDEFCWKIINEFEKNYLINDQELSESIIEYCLVIKKGKNTIKEKLSNRLIELNYDEVIEKYLNVEKYFSNIKYQIEKYQRLAIKKSNKEFRKYLINKMIENGYEYEEFSEYIGDISLDERRPIKKELDKFFKNNEINRENIIKITKKLLSKGFNYDIIKSVIGECEYNETY